MKKNILMICLTALLLVSGCAQTEMNKLERQYSEEKVTALAKEYLENKYGEIPQINNITSYQDICGGLDATYGTAFKGFVLETGNYLMFMDFSDDGSYTFSDTKQSDDILQDMREELTKVYSGNAYLSMLSLSEKTTNDGSTKLPYLLEKSQSYQTLYSGNLSDLFSKESNNHKVYIYLDTADYDEAENDILQAFQNISQYVTVIEYEPGLYDELKGHFDDWDYMKKFDNPLYYRRKGDTREGLKETYVPYQKITDGMYVKSVHSVKLYSNIEDGLKTILQTRPDSGEAMYIPDGSERGILVSENLMAFSVLKDISNDASNATSCQDSEISFYEIRKEGKLHEADQKENELLNSYEGIRGKAATIYGGAGYLIIK